MTMTNLLKETVECIINNKKKLSDVQYVSDLYNWCSWDDFVKDADFEYNSGYGGNNINLTLKVVGKDWWLERGEYDGAEWWEFKTLPTQPITNKPLMIRHE